MKKFFTKKILIALAGFTAFIGGPAVANDFGGVYLQGTAGVEDVTKAPETSDVTYGANAGVNIPLGNVIVGVEATVDNVLDRNREIGASARLGYAAGRVMPYVEAGYTNYKDAFSRKLEGLRVGGGVEYNISNHTFVSAEYRYTDFDAGVGKHAGLVGLGLRF